MDLSKRFLVFMPTEKMDLLVFSMRCSTRDLLDCQADPLASHLAFFDQCDSSPKQRISY